MHFFRAVLFCLFLPYNIGMRLFFLILAAILAVLLILAGVFFQFTFTRRGMRIPGKPYLKEGEYDLRSWKKFEQRHMEDFQWLTAQPMDEVTIVSDDGLKLCGHYFRADSSRRIILCVHGYRGLCFHDFASAGRFLHAQNCDLLLIDQRASGKSEGEFITFGAKEKTDIRAWCDYLADHNPQDLPVYLYGLSMGCTTVLCALDQGVDTVINGVIADCGFSSIRAILAHQSSHSFHIPPYPALKLLGLFCILRAGFRFDEGDAEKTLRSCTVPILFIHGAQDHFVPPDNTIRNYEACASKKELVLVEGAIHGSSYNTNEALYQSKLLSFFEQNDGNHSQEI